MPVVYYETPTVSLIATDTYQNRIPHPNIIGETINIVVRDSATKQIIEVPDWMNDQVYPQNGIVINCSTDLSVIIGMEIDQSALITPNHTPTLTNLVGAILLFFVLGCSSCFGQGYYTPITGNTMQRGSVAITRKGNTDTTHHTSAILELSATDRGLLFTRLTEAQMLAISAPVAGLEIYNTDSAAYFYFNGSQWVALHAGSYAGLPAWLLGGNSGTGTGNFIGTIDSQRLSIKTNNALRLSIGNGPKTITAYQDSFLGMYRTPSLKATADSYGFMTSTMFSWIDSASASNQAYLTTGVDNFAYSTGDIFGVGNNYHSDIVDRHYGNKRDVMLSIDKTPHKRIQVEAFDNAVTDTISGDAEISIYDPAAGHDVISLQLFKSHASGDLKTSLYDTARAIVLIKDEIGAAGNINESYQNTDSLVVTGLKKIVFNNDIRIVNGSQGKNKVAISDNYGTISFQTLAALLSLVVSYSDDTAAAAAGLSIGDTYYNTTTKAYTRRTI